MARPPSDRERIEPVLDSPRDEAPGAFDIRLGDEDRPAGGQTGPRAGRGERDRRDAPDRDPLSRNEPSFGRRAGRSEPASGPAERTEPSFSATGRDRTARTAPGRVEPRMDERRHEERRPEDPSGDPVRAPSDAPAPRLGAADAAGERASRPRAPKAAADRRQRSTEPDASPIDIEDAEFIELDEDDPMADSRRSSARRSKAPAAKKARGRGRKRSARSGSFLGRLIRGCFKWALVLLFWGTVAVGGTIAYFATQLPFGRCPSARPISASSPMTER
jgi:penicillin-binding protein 1A